MDEWMEVWLQPCRERSLYSRQEFEHSIVCFGKIRDGTAKASRAQFTLLNRRNGLEASDEHRLFPRYSAFKLSFRAVHLSLSLLLFLRSSSISYSTRATVCPPVSSGCPLRFTDSLTWPDKIPRYNVTPISSSTLDWLVRIFWHSDRNSKLTREFCLYSDFSKKCRDTRFPRREGKFGLMNGFYFGSMRVSLITIYRENNLAMCRVEMLRIVSIIMINILNCIYISNEFKFQTS